MTSTDRLAFRAASEALSGWVDRIADAHYWVEKGGVDDWLAYAELLNVWYEGEHCGYDGVIRSKLEDLARVAAPGGVPYDHPAFGRLTHSSAHEAVIEIRKLLYATLMVSVMQLKLPAGEELKVAVTGAFRRVPGMIGGLNIDRTAMLASLLQERAKVLDTGFNQPAGLPRTAIGEAGVPTSEGPLAAPPASAETTVGPTRNGPSGVPTHLPPRIFLSGWQEITAALGLRYVDRRRVGRLNKLSDGPIGTRGKGSSPEVYQDALIEWWNSLAERLQELEDRRRDEKATVQDTFDYGRDGKVVPGINGEVKKGRGRK
jgi:hypothetical protein